MACSFYAGDTKELEKSFASSLLLLNTPSKKDKMIYDFEIEKQKEHIVI